MADLSVDSMELEDNSHPDEDDHSTKLGNVGCKNKICNKTIRRKKVSKPKDRPWLQK